MREIHNGAIIPDFIVKPVEVPGIGRKPEMRLELVKEFDYKSRAFTQYCMTERDIAAPALREFFNRTIMVMNMWEDPQHPRRWLGGRFTPEQYLDLVNRCEKPDVRKAGLAQRVWVAQYGKAKWPTGGGRNAQAAGKFFYGTEDVVKDLYKKYLLVDTDKMKPGDRVSRTSILFGHPKVFTDAAGIRLIPRVVFAEYKTYGTALVDRRFAEATGIKHGDKLWPIKASAVVMDLGMEGADIIVPQDSVKFKEHAESTRLLAGLLGTMPDLTAKTRSSIEKDRLPKLAFDTLQWLFPELGKILDTDPMLSNRLALVKRVVEGTASVEEVLSLAEYTDAMGNKAYPAKFHYLINGHPKEDAELRGAILQVAGTAAFKALCFRARGRYGVAMPLTDIKHKAVVEAVEDAELAFSATGKGDEGSAEMILLMPPWMLPMRAKASYSIEHVVQVESEWAVGYLGKDYDGDLIMSLEINGLLRRLGLTKDVFLSWNNPEDREFVKRFMSLPKKKKADESRSVHQVMADGIKSYGLIGQATNMCMVIVDAMRATGLFSRPQLMGVYLHLMSVEVQPFVDALKYDPNELKKPVLATKYGKNGKVLQEGLAAKYGLDPTTGKPIVGFEHLCEKVQGYFRAVRGMDFGKMCDLPEDNDLNGSFYYRLSRLFAGWRPYAAVDLKQVATKLAAKYPLPEVLEKARAMSFKQWKTERLTPEGLATKRWESLKHMVTNNELTVALIARAWLKDDTRFALAVSKATGITLIEAEKAMYVDVVTEQAVLAALEVKP